MKDLKVPALLGDILGNFGDVEHVIGQSATNIFDRRTVENAQKELRTLSVIFPEALGLDTHRKLLKVNS